MLGHHGKAVVRISIDTAGAVTLAEIADSSRSDLLDASALATARTARFTPALDGNGNPLPLTFLAPYEFYKSQSSEPGGGLVHYNCADFTLDTDWWESINPVVDGKREKTRLEIMLLGLRVIAASNDSLFPGDAESFRNVMDAHRRNWAKAREKCRANPDRLLVDYLNQRKAIERLSEMEAREAS